MLEDHLKLKSRKMDTKKFSEKTKNFLQDILGTGEKWLAEEIKKIFDRSSDEKDFLEEVNLYLTRLELKIKSLKKECENLTVTDET